LNTLDRLLARIAQPAFVLRVAALAICLLELSAVVSSLSGNRSEAYDGVLAALFHRWGGSADTPALVLTCFALVLLFFLQFWRLARQTSLDQPPRATLAQVLALNLMALLVTPGLPFLVTALAAVLLARRTAFLFALSQVLINVSLYWLLPSEAQQAEQLALDIPAWAHTLSLTMEMVALHGMAFGLGRMAAAEAEKRRWLQAMLAEKLSNEKLQAEQLRYAERMLMARELHDVMGHHLTALNLHLQLSSGLLQRADVAGATLAVDKAREGAANLLADVRAAVSHERSSQRIDLSTALHTLAQGIASVQIQLQLNDAARDLSPRAAHALLRCVQEAVTNSVRHARAGQVSIELTVNGSGDHEQVRVTIADDGTGAPRLREGNGLKGMQERMAELGGQMRIVRNSPGFMIELSLPRSC